MWIGAAVCGIGGLMLAFNIGGTSDRLASLGASLPLWFRGHRGTYPIVYRVGGLAFLVFSVLIALSANKS